MLVVPEATARPTILSQRCRPKEPLPKNPVPRNPGRRKQNRPMARPPLYPAPSPLSPKKPPAQIKKESILKRKTKNGTGKIIHRLLGITPTPLRLARRKNGTTAVTESAIIARRKAIFRGTARNLQKASVGLGNLRVKD